MHMENDSGKGREFAEIQTSKRKGVIFIKISRSELNINLVRRSASLKYTLTSLVLSNLP